MARRTHGLLTLLLALLAAVLLTCNVVLAQAPNARASHILVNTEAECDALLVKLNDADNLESTFAELASAKSKCPSKRKGGDLGYFGRGQMVAEFDRVVFEKPVGLVHKVHTQFGWHLVLTTERTGMGDDDAQEDSEEPVPEDDETEKWDL